VDSIVAAGVHFHDPVRVEATSNLNATYNNGTAGVGATLTNAGTQAALVLDGVTLSVADRVLIYLQTDQTENGVYVVTDTGSVSTNWILTRASDADTYVVSSPDGLSEGSTFFVLEGTIGAGDIYSCNTAGVITFGTTNITFAQIGTAQIYTAGAGLDLTGVQFSVETNGITNAMLRQSAGLSVIGRSGNTTGDVADVTAGTDHQVLRRSGTAVGFGAVALDQSAAVSGTLPVTSGGTGQTSFTNGELLIGNTTGNTLTKATLTPGSGISITNGNGAITIAASGGGVSSVSGTGTVQGITLSGTVTSSGNLTLGGSLSAVSLTSQVSGTLPVANGGTGITSFGAGVATFLNDPTSGNLAAAVTNETGSGALVFATSPSLVTPNLGTPSSGTLTNCTSLPVSTGISGLASGVGTFLGTPTSANLASAVTDETGTGALVFGTTPTLTAVRETSVAIAASDINLSLGNYFTRTISGATTFTISNAASSGSVNCFALILTNGGSATVNWFSGVTWNEGTPPTLSASGVDVLVFFTINGGTTWRGFLSGKAMA
jgi:hypothetical protein